MECLGIPFPRSILRTLPSAVPGEESRASGAFGQFPIPRSLSKDGEAHVNGAQDPRNEERRQHHKFNCRYAGLARRSRPTNAMGAFAKTINTPPRLNMCDHSKSEAGAAADGPRVTAHFEKLVPPRAKMIVSAMRRVHCPVCVVPPFTA
jgi:hypothetical protein